jgi:hypothetical protein
MVKKPRRLGWRALDPSIATLMAISPLESEPVTYASSRAHFWFLIRRPILLWRFSAARYSFCSRSSWFKHRQYPGRPRVAAEVRPWWCEWHGKTRIGDTTVSSGRSNLGHQASDQTVGDILRRHGIAPARKRGQTTTWKDFIAAHMNVLAGADFFTVEVLTWRGLVTYYVLFFIHLDNRRVKDIRIKRGWSRSLVARLKRPGDIWKDAIMFCMIATPNSAPRFGRCWRRAA